MVCMSVCEPSLSRKMKRLLVFLILFTFCAGVACMCGCSKDRVLDIMNSAMMNAGDNILTKNSDLHGVRKFGTDSYAGTYEVSCEDASFREKLFGNTSIERTDGYTLNVHAQIDGTEGTAKLELQQDNEDPQVLFEGLGTFDKEVEIAPGSAYFTLDTENFTGDISISIK